MTKLMYRAVSMLVGLASGLLAGAIFKKAWQLAAGEDEAPKATDARRNWPEILIASALQGVIFAVVRATVDRLAAAGTHSLTGTWPGEGSDAIDGRKGKKA
ncbi:MAG: DUF4235 domain-containing protein [Actinobacteria bacterium]|nr:DUF4235 domain-containing protein [Actinomycetota bacterium]